MSRFPGWVYRNGAEPDAKFRLANERTWVGRARTERSSRLSCEIPGPTADGIIPTVVLAAAVLVVVGSR